jgi:hypothetical protein
LACPASSVERSIFIDIASAAAPAHGATASWRQGGGVSTVTAERLRELLEYDPIAAFSVAHQFQNGKARRRRWIRQ